MRRALAACVTLVAALGIGSTPAAADGPDFSLASRPSQINIDRGSTVTTTVTTTPSGGFSGTVTFGVSGLPSGVTGSFSPASVPAGASTTLTLTAAFTPSRNTATVTGTGGGLTRSTFISVGPSPVSDFAVIPLGSGVTVARGGSGSIVIATTPQTGFNGSVVFSLRGVPAGVTATFNPASPPAGSRSTLTFAASSSAPPGTSSVTVTGVAGFASASASFSLTVT